MVLYWSYLRGAVARVLQPGSPTTPGSYLRRPLTVAVRGAFFRLRAESDDIEFVLPYHKPSVENWFKPRPGDYVVDVGAHLGFYTIMAAKAGARVLAIEPNPEVFAGLLENLSLNSLPEVRALNCAAGKSTGLRDLRVPTLFSGFGSLRPDWVPTNAVSSSIGLHEFQVNVDRLDTLVRPDSPVEVSWLLIDVEGAEADVLGGATNCLRRTRNLVLEVDRETNTMACRRLIEDAGLRVMTKEHQSARTDYWLARRGG